MMRYRRSRSAARTRAPVRSCAPSTRAPALVCDTHYISAISADGETHRRADLRELSQIEPDTEPEPAQSSWVDSR